MCVITEHAECHRSLIPHLLSHAGERGRNLHPPRERGPASPGAVAVPVTSRAWHGVLRWTGGYPERPPDGSVQRSAPSPCGLLGPLSSTSASVDRVVPHGAGPRRAGRLGVGPRKTGLRVLPTPGLARAGSLFSPLAAGFPVGRELPRMPRSGSQRAGCCASPWVVYCFLEEDLGPKRARGSGIGSRGWAVRSGEGWCLLLPAARLLLCPQSEGLWAWARGMLTRSSSGGLPKELDRPPRHALDNLLWPFVAWSLFLLVPLSQLLSRQ